MVQAEDQIRPQVTKDQIYKGSDLERAFYNYITLRVLEGE